MFKGENLQYLRRLYGYSQEKLAKLLYTSVENVRLYEANEKEPDFQIVNRLRLLFYVRGRYFYRKQLVDRYKSEKRKQEPIDITHSSKRITNISKAQTETLYIEYLDSFVNYLTKDLEVPLGPIFALKEQASQTLKNPTMSREERIRYIASLARKEIGLKEESNRRLLFLLEKSGVFIFEKMLGDAREAYSLWIEGSRPYIFLRKYGDAAGWRNFDLAHELGHLLLHHHIEFSTISEEKYEELEAEANRFALHFLLPEEEFMRDMRSVLDWTDPDGYVNMKRKWDVSLYWLGYRAFESGLITAKEHRQFFQTMRQKGYWEWEPLDEMYLLQQPQKMLAIFEFVFNENLVDFATMLEEEWLFELEFLAKITGIDAHFFNRYMMKRPRFMQEKRIVPFTRTNNRYS